MSELGASARADEIESIPRREMGRASARPDSIAIPQPEDLAARRKLRARPHADIDVKGGCLATRRVFRGHYHRLVVLAAAEALVVMVAIYVAALLHVQDMGWALLQRFLTAWPHALASAGVTIFCLASMGLYQLRQRAEYPGVLARIIVAVVMAAVTMVLVHHVSPGLLTTPGMLFVAAGLAMGGLSIARYGYMRFVDQDVFKRRVLVWGCGARAATIATRLRRRSDQRGFRIVGYVRAPGERPQVASQLLLEHEHDLLAQILRNQVEEIVVAMDDRRCGFPHALLRECRLRGIVVRDIVTFLEHETGRVSVDLAQPSWLIFCDGFRSDFVRAAGKRALDICISVVLLLVAAPIALATAIAIYIEDRGPVVYRQVRTGQHGRTFSMLKFRSMRVNAEVKGQAIWAAKNDPRVTRVGAFIRKVRIDELPQAINVLLGHMSFVGPRPERPTFVQTLSGTIPFYAERHFVKPGITGWAQVCFPYGCSEADAREKLGYDLYYVKNHGVLFDLMVMLRTVEIVLFRVGSR